MQQPALPFTRWFQPKSREFTGRKRVVEKYAYTWTLSTVITALGVLAAIRSEAAISAATAKAMVVKNPKTFWARTSAECIVSHSLVGFC